MRSIEAVGSSYTCGDRLSELRRIRSLSIPEAARRLGCRTRVWRAWEAGEKRPREDSLAGIVHALKLTPAELHYLITGKMQEGTVRAAGMG